MTKRILVPVSPFAPWASILATALANLEDPAIADPILLHVFTDEEKQAALNDTDLGENATVNQLAKSKSSVIAARKMLSESEFDVDIVGTVSDDLGSAILNTAETMDADCIYLFSRRRSSAGKAVFGSTIQYILLNATLPIITIPPNATPLASTPASND